MRKKQNNVRKTNRILIIVTVVFACYTAINSIDTQIQINEKNNSIDALSSEIAEKEQIKEEFQAELETGATNEAIAKVAREKLGLASPGERIIVDIGSK